jgi:lysophospholipase L1-like esterase
MTPARFPFFLVSLVFLSASVVLPAQESSRKVLFLGNSITLHGPKADIDWTGNWGMAASVAEKDYVHLVTAALAARSATAPEVMVKNIADFERAYAGYDIAGKLKEQIDFKADLIIVAIGENVAALKTAEEEAAFLKAVTVLLQSVKGGSDATVLVRSSFWANPAKDKSLAEACTSVGGVFVDISALGKDESNNARSEREFKHAGVANHPGDKGMAAIADAIVKALAE